MTKLEPALQDAAKRLKAIAPDAVVGYRGSIASGVRMKKIDGVLQEVGPYDPNNFDLDGFIVSDTLARRIPGRGFRDGRAIGEVADEAKKIEELLGGSFSGYRSDPSKPFTFRIWTTEEFERIVKEGPHVIF